MSASARASGARPHRLRLLIEVPAVIVLFVMMIHVTANALLRAFASSPIQNTLEITQYIYLPIIALLGFVAAQQRGEHIVADLVTHYFPRQVRRGVLFAGYTVALIVSAGFAWFGLEEALHARDIGQTAGVSTVVSWPVLFLVPVVFAVLTVQFGLAAVRAVRGAEDEDRDATMAGDIDGEVRAGHSSAVPTGTTSDSEKK
ncbi:TRAP transporter small permease [Nocardia flavorosea]|uniref:TRAP transporter small permease n=1 Tax=Nocardia flavorosea TaxID=53429 RepID=A0A846YD88_9NOCA|nr:TRAP transporter small permease [Nocardia flavorosea]NKY55138.1 TRAP transporter small permease [Nocardia flavorosea]